MYVHNQEILLRYIVQFKTDYMNQIYSKYPTEIRRIRNIKSKNLKYFFYEKIFRFESKFF